MVVDRRTHSCWSVRPISSSKMVVSGWSLGVIVTLGSMNDSNCCIRERQRNVKVFNLSVSPCSWKFIEFWCMKLVSIVCFKLSSWKEDVSVWVGFIDKLNFCRLAHSISKRKDWTLKPFSRYCWGRNIKKPTVVLNS